MARKRQPPLKEMQFREAFTNLTYEECPRISSCQLCTLPIQTGARRVALTTSLRAPIEQRAGKMFKKRWFFHTHCLSQWIGSDDYDTPFQCCDCGVKLSTPAGSIWAGRRGSLRYLCETCVRTPRWRYCQRCTHYAHRYESSEIINEGIRTDYFCCDRCQEQDGIWTVKAQKRAKRNNG